jgi:flagellar basal-body rod modification protein FlgD
VIIPVSPVTGQATASAAGADAMASQLDQETFLQLMVAQLRNQDPLNPTDSSQFLAQTAQFTSVEKLQQVAEQSAQALAAQMAFGATNLVGRNVTYTGADGVESTGTVASVRFGTSGPQLVVGDTEIALAQVVTVEA